jgi:ABC-2 type transport system permease protein
LWLKSFFDQLSAIRGPLWPSTWVTEGIIAAARHDPGKAFYYLFVTFANGLFLSWVVVLVASRRLSEAFARAQSRSTREVGLGRRVTAWITSVLFFYLPRRMWLLTLKDVRTLFRDPLQWSQLAILFGLLALYVANIPRLTLDITSVRWQVLVSFLNLAAISLILATFTGRFVFPMVSLEGRQIWLLAPMPLSRSTLLAGKFIFALTTTMVCAVAVTALSLTMLELGRVWWFVHLTAVTSVCIGLCGLAVGLGARLPMFGQADGARIASGMGGTINLIASVLLVVGVLVLMGALSAHAAHRGELVLDRTTLPAVGLVVLLGPLVAGAAMRLGAKHLRTAEF